jgi:hypothetical protein
MEEMGIEAIYPHRRLSEPAPEHRIYPYLLCGVEIERVNQVWSTDITYIRMRRVFPKECAWQAQTPQGVVTKTVRGYEFTAGYYEWGDLKYVPSWGGSMFEALMPVLMLDEREHTRHSLGQNGVVHAIIQRRYALDALGYPVWGLSPSSIPGGGYGEFGVKVLGMNGYGNGVITPYASALALSVTSEEAIANLRRLAELYDIYGEYGFYDAVDPRTGKVDYAYLSLDQAMLFIAIANYLKEDCIHTRFASDPLVARMLPVIGEENFFE